MSGGAVVRKCSDREGAYDIGLEGSICGSGALAGIVGKAMVEVGGVEAGEAERLAHG